MAHTGWCVQLSRQPETEESEKADMPQPSIEAADFMLATAHKRPFSDTGWRFELKYDGYRCLVRKSSGAVRLISRAGNALNDSFPDIVEAVAEIRGDFVIDAELTVDDDSGRSSFERLRKRAATKRPTNVRAAIREHPARLYAFDLLASGSSDLRKQALSERTLRLQDVFENTRTLLHASGIEGAGEWVFEQARMRDLEGMVAKRLASAYVRGRSRDWLKVKNPDYSRRAALGFGNKN
jgi:ATP-dependent DNA ligase